MGYCTTDELRSGFNVQDRVDGKPELLQLAIDAASKAIDTHCSRTFAKTDTATGRVYAATSSDVLEVHDFWTTTGLAVEVDYALDGSFGTVLAAGTVQAEPLNADALGRPWTRLRLVTTTATPYPLGGQGFPVTSRAAVRVTAKWGWAAVPADVHQACLLQAARLFKRQEAPFGVIGTAEIGTARLLARLDPDVAVLLADYVPGGAGASAYTLKVS